MTPTASDTVIHATRAPDQFQTRKGARGWLWTIVILLVIGGLGYGGYRWYAASSATPAGEGGAGHGHGGRGAGGPPPVVVGKSSSGDFQVYLDALGSVTPLNTITVRSRVDGELMKVSYTEGQIVKKGDVLAEIDPRPYQAQLLQAQGQLIKDQAELKNANADLQRYTIARETVSQQQIDTAQAAVAQYQGAIKIDQGAIDTANLQLTYCSITAPLTGKIGLRMVDPGNIVHASDTTGIAVITQLQPIAVVFNLPENQLPSVLAAMRGDQTLAVDVLSSDRSVHLASGKLHAIDNQIDASTATVRIKAVFNNEDGLLYPNQFVNIRLLVQTLTHVVLAPTPAIQESPDTLFVYVVKADKTVEMRPVTTGQGDAQVTVIEKGLQPGETVVTDGVDKLAPGMAVIPHMGSLTTQPAGEMAQEATTQPAAAGHTHQHSGNGGGHRDHSATQNAQPQASE